MDQPVNGPKNEEMWARYDAVIPGGGVYVTRSARFAGRDVMPGFIESAEGCRLTDVDGKSYIDFNCGNGPNLLGYRFPEVDKAAFEQSQIMDLSAFFPAKMPDYAERLLEWAPDFDWAIFTKNGSDSTNLSLRIMRAAKNRPYIVLLKSAYHGFGVELALSPEAGLEEHQKFVIRVPWNDPQALLEVADQYGEQLAGLMLNPLDQNPVQETVDISPEMVTALKEFRRRTGALIAIDDVRHGFRIHPKGSHIHMGIDPDLLCLGKAQANGYATSTILGKEAVRAGAEEIQFTATYMFSPVSFVAGITTLNVYERDNVFQHMEDMGTLLKDGLEKIGRETGHEDIIMTGPPAMLTLLFSKDQKAKRARTFGRHAAQLGAIFHPTLTWFISYAHKQADIEEALDIARKAFEQTPTDVEQM